MRDPMKDAEPLLFFASSLYFFSPLPLLLVDNRWLEVNVQLVSDVDRPPEPARLAASARPVAPKPRH